MRLWIEPAFRFRAAELLIHRSVARSFSVLWIAVGKACQTSGHPIPAALFRRRFKFAAAIDVAGPSIPFSICVHNISKAPATFRATIWGTYVDKLTADDFEFLRRFKSRRHPAAA